MESIKKQIRYLKYNTDSRLKKSIIADLLSRGDAEKIKEYLGNEEDEKFDLITNEKFICSKDIRNFFEKHYEEIFRLAEKYYKETDVFLGYKIGSLSLFAYKKILKEIQSELDFNEDRDIIKLQQDKKELEKLNRNLSAGTIFNKDDNQELKMQSHIMELLLMYFINDTSKCIKLLEDISQEKSIVADKFDEVNGFNLLYIAMMLGEDSRVIDKFNSISKLINNDEGEAELYKKFYSLISEPNAEDAIDFVKFVNNIEFKYIYKDINDKLREYLKSSVLNSLQGKVKISEEFSLVSKKKMRCTYDGLKLEEKFILLKYYSKKNKGKIGLIDTEAFVCKSCGRVYLTDEQYNKVKMKIGDNKVKQVSYTIPITIGGLNKNLKKTVIYHEKVQSNLPVKIEPKPQNKTIKTSYENIPLNDKSELGSLGYSTSLSREMRWNILKNRAIPKLGVEKTKYIIKFFIKFNGKAKNKQNALVEWQYDLNRLNTIIK